MTHTLQRVDIKTKTTLEILRDKPLHAYYKNSVFLYWPCQFSLAIFLSKSHIWYPAVPFGPFLVSHQMVTVTPFHVNSRWNDAIIYLFTLWHCSNGYCNLRFLKHRGHQLCLERVASWIVQREIFHSSSKRSFLMQISNDFSLFTVGDLKTFFIIDKIQRFFFCLLFSTQFTKITQCVKTIKKSPNKF